jgi:hypothetical protein
VQQQPQPNQLAAKSANSQYGRAVKNHHNYKNKNKTSNEP